MAAGGRLLCCTATVLDGCQPPGVVVGNILVLAASWPSPSLSLSFSLSLSLALALSKTSGYSVVAGA